MKTMKLSLMFLDNSVKELAINRLFTTNTTTVGPVLYYETYSDIPGKGHSIPLSELKCWEAEPAERQLGKMMDNKQSQTFENVIDKPIYVLRVGSKKTSMPNHYSYRIYPVKLAIKEVRLGKAINDEKDAIHYGPGSVTWLCRYNNGYIQAFSSVDGEILSTQMVAGRQVRGFLDISQLDKEAEILKKLIYQNYKNVDEVEICLSEYSSKNLSDKIQSAEGKKALPKDAIAGSTKTEPDR